MFDRRTYPMPRTEAWRRATAMGWKFSDVTVEPSPHEPSMLTVGCSFTCVCGRTEHWRCIVWDGHLEAVGLAGFDPVHQIASHGSFSPKHLREDGYTEEQIADIMARAKEFA